MSVVSGLVRAAKAAVGEVAKTGPLRRARGAVQVALEEAQVVVDTLFPGPPLPPSGPQPEHERLGRARELVARAQERWQQQQQRGR